MSNESSTAGVDQLHREVATLRAQLDESEALVGMLRQRTVILNNEVRYRDGLIAERDSAIAALTRQLKAADLADRPTEET